jgi:RNA polymerase sigma-70 factor (ECF subfamily)
VFLRKGPLSGEWRWRRLPARANGQVAVGAYTWREDERAFLPFALDVLTLAGGQISDVTAFILRSSEPRTQERFQRYPNEAIDPAKVASTFARLGLPNRLD